MLKSLEKRDKDSDFVVKNKKYIYFDVKKRIINKIIIKAKIIKILYKWIINKGWDRKV